MDTSIPLDRSLVSIQAWIASLNMWAGNDKARNNEAAKAVSYGIRFIKSKPAKAAATKALEIYEIKSK